MPKEAESKLSTVDLALNFASIVNFIALILLLRAVIKNRNTLRGYSISGCFLTFVSICGFEVAYYLMGNIISFVLGFATVVFWFTAFVYSLRQKLSSKNAKTSAVTA
jgi:hypothetical protein